MFFCSTTFKNVEIFHKNFIFVAETHIYTKPLTPNGRLLYHYTKQRAFGVGISK